MGEELPDWLAEMRDQQFGEEPKPSPPPLIEPIEEAVFPEPESEPSPPPPQFDMVEGLREQIGESEEELDYGEKSKIAQLLAEQEFVRFFMRLQPWQRFVLAVVLFMDVAVCGCIALVITQRVWLPF